MKIIQFKGSKRVDTITTAKNQEQSFKQLLELNNNIPYKSNVNFRFSDKLIQNRYENWVKSN